MTTVKPSLASRSAIAAPMPREAPVTMAIWFILEFMLSSFIECHRMRCTAVSLVAQAHNLKVIGSNADSSHLIETGRPQAEIGADVSAPSKTVWAIDRRLEGESPC